MLRLYISLTPMHVISFHAADKIYCIRRSITTTTTTTLSIGHQYRTAHSAVNPYFISLTGVWPRRYSHKRAVGYNQYMGVSRITSEATVNALIPVHFWSERASVKDSVERIAGRPNQEQRRTERPSERTQVSSSLRRLYPASRPWAASSKHALSPRYHCVLRASSI